MATVAIPSACVTLLKRVSNSRTGCQTLQVLLVKRLHHPKKGFWGIPGGKFDPHVDKSLADTARREMLEETNLAVNVPSEYYHQHSVMGGRYLIHHFLAREAQLVDVSALRACTDAEAVAWHDVDPIIDKTTKEPMVDDLPGVLRIAKELFLNT
jgi:ADP-ribose pyrophosphatase YjhB (NUDIX family)